MLRLAYGGVEACLCIFNKQDAFSDNPQLIYSHSNAKHGFVLNEYYAAALIQVRAGSLSCVVLL